MRILSIIFDNNGAFKTKKHLHEYTFSDFIGVTSRVAPFSIIYIFVKKK